MTLPRATVWNTRTIHRPWLDLSERRPVQCLHHVYGRTKAGALDMHFGLELGIVLTGRMRRLYRDGKTNLGPGQAWLCGMWEPHGFEVVKAPCEVAVLVVWPPMLASLRFEEAPAFSWLAPFTVPYRRRPKARGAVGRELLVLARQAAAIEPIDDTSRLRLRVLLMQIVLTLCRNWKTLPEADLVASDSFSKINRVLQRVFDDRRKLTVTEASRLCGLNRNAFAALFKQLMGLGFADFSLRHRLHGVAVELLATSNPVKALAARWGFTDASHLQRRFHDHYGCSPSQYRRRAAGRLS